MSAQIQIEMFKESPTTDALQAEIVALRESHDKVRRKLFGQTGDLMKKIMQQQEELDFLKMKMGLSCILEKQNEGSGPC